ncbi:c-type cytochrome domain-containing protein [Paludisphaera rhizosphaerae]|nr:c-type cytochrome domain-containing protein [Paludisphaera rhizosphaerae]
MPLHLLAATLIAIAPTPDYKDGVAPVLKKYCAGCHDAEEPEGDFSVATYAALRKGGSRGAAVVAGDPKKSLMMRLMTGGGKPVMPPKNEPKPSADEITLIEAWIAAGAQGPVGEEPPRLALAVPKVPSHAKVRPVAALDVSRDGRLTAVARDAEVTLVEGTDASKGRTIGKHPGQVTAVHFTADGQRLVTASGVAGLGGFAAIWNTADGSLVRSFEGHHDILYDAELSPDGRRLATCSYDKNIEIRDAATGALLHTLEGHTGAVYDLAFSPDGRFLVTASADDTCKVWRVEDGTRMDTLPQPLKAEFCCTFTPDGRSIVAGGGDGNIRVWRFDSREKPGLNPMTFAKFAHEGTIIHLTFSPDGATLVTTAEDRTVKVWRASDYSEIHSWPDQPDVPSALAFASASRIDVGRMDGSLATFTVPRNATADAAPAQPAPAVLAVSESEESVQQGEEHEPNNQPEQALAIRIPARITGKIADGPAAGGDVDYYRFSAKAGEQFIFEIDAARSAPKPPPKPAAKPAAKAAAKAETKAVAKPAPKAAAKPDAMAMAEAEPASKLDSFIEVLNAKGERIPRVVLQAVRESYFTFRGKDGNQFNDFRIFNWEEMSIDEYLYANGEVAKLWLAPRGADSGFLVYPGRAGRWGYFDTTPLAHALNEPCYIVQPHPPGTKIAQNRLPVFTIHYENDDDSLRELGKDSKLTFTAPADGEYLVKVRDVRGLQGPDHGYTLIARPRRPDFSVTTAVVGKTPKIPPGGGREFRVSARRIDGYDGPIRVDLEGLPQGFHASTPVVIEAGQVDAEGVIFADPGATAPEEAEAKLGKFVATAQIDGRSVTHEAGALGAISIDAESKLKVAIAVATDGAQPVAATGDGPLEFVVEAGKTITLKLVVERNGFDGPIPFGTEGAGRNLPYGAFVDNLGLNGLLVVAGQNERTFFVTAGPTVGEQVRPLHLTTAAGGGASSRPVLLRVVKPAPGSPQVAGTASTR